MEEYWDALNGNRKYLGMRLRCGNPIPAGFYHLMVRVIIFNQNGEFLSQQRAASRHFPGMWDYTAGGSALAGESSQKAASRKLREELGIYHDFSRLKPVFSFRGSDYFDDYYFLFRDVDLKGLKFEDGGVIRAQWLSFDKARRGLKAGIFVPCSTIDAVEFTYLKMALTKQYPESIPLLEQEAAD